LIRRSFNGATPPQAWKLGMRFAESSLRVALQWGHASSGVETGLWAGGQPVGCASMGPRLLRRGNDAIGGASNPLMLLQWGHASSGVETRSPISAIAAGGAASMGPRLLRRGNYAVSSEDGADAMLQWGHASSGVETTWVTNLTVGTSDGFNGATPPQAWKPGFRRRLR